MKGKAMCGNCGKVGDEQLIVDRVCCKGNFETINEKEVDSWCDGNFGNHMLAWFTQVLNGIYNLEEARNDVMGFRK